MNWIHLIGNAISAIVCFMIAWWGRGKVEQIRRRWERDRATIRWAEAVPDNTHRTIATPTAPAGAVTLMFECAGCRKMWVYDGSWLAEERTTEHKTHGGLSTFWFDADGKLLGRHLIGEWVKSDQS